MATDDRSWEIKHLRWLKSERPLRKKWQLVVRERPGVASRGGHIGGVWLPSPVVQLHLHMQKVVFLLVRCIARDRLARNLKRREPGPAETHRAAARARPGSAQPALYSCTHIETRF
jgi:hypothetical protein